MTSICRSCPDPRTCVFILNCPDVRTQHDITEPEVRAACQNAGLSRLTYVNRQTHSVFVASFSSKYDAQQARQKVQLRFQTSLSISAPSVHLTIKAESHFLEINRVFVFETSPGFVRHKTVCLRVFEALAGPLTASMLLFRQQLQWRNGVFQRTRYILRPSEAVCPMFVETFYIPLDAASGSGKIGGIFKPSNRHWTCPACHEKCQSGEWNACRFSTLLFGPETAEGITRNHSQ
jgi:hypothetical protein